MKIMKALAVLTIVFVTGVSMVASASRYVMSRLPEPQPVASTIGYPVEATPVVATIDGRPPEEEINMAVARRTARPISGSDLPR